MSRRKQGRLRKLTQAEKHRKALQLANTPRFNRLDQKRQVRVLARAVRTLV